MYGGLFQRKNKAVIDISSYISLYSCSLPVNVVWLYKWSRCCKVSLRNTQVIVLEIYFLTNITKCTVCMLFYLTEIHLILVFFCKHLILLPFITVWFIKSDWRLEFFSFFRSSLKKLYSVEITLVLLNQQNILVYLFFYFSPTKKALCLY